VLRNWIFTGRILKFDPLPFTLYKSNSKWIRDLNVTPEALKLLEKTQECKTGPVWGQVAVRGEDTWKVRRVNVENETC
jgi:hypothetical protein